MAESANLYNRRGLHTQERRDAKPKVGEAQSKSGGVKYIVYYAW